MTMRHWWSRRTGQGRQRGATAIEYGLIVSVLMIALNSGVNRFQDSEGEKVEQAEDRVGTPTEELSFNAGASGNPLPPSGGGGSSTAVTATVTIAGSATTQSGNKWTAIAEMTTVDASGAPILDAQISGIWILTAPDGSTSTQAATCDTDSSGVCNLSIWNLRQPPHSSGTVDATFVIDGVTGQDLTPAAGTIGSSVTVLAP